MRNCFKHFQDQLRWCNSPAKQNWVLCFKSDGFGIQNSSSGAGRCLQEMRLDKCRAINPLCSQITDSPIPRAPGSARAGLNCCRLSSCTFPAHPGASGSPPQPKKPISFLTCEVHTRRFKPVLIRKCRCKLWKKAAPNAIFCLVSTGGP